MFSFTAIAVCRPHSPMHWPVTVLALLFTVANPLWPATGNATIDEMVTHMPGFMFIALPLIVAAWGVVQIFQERREPETIVEPATAGKHDWVRSSEVRTP